MPIALIDFLYKDKEHFWWGVWLVLCVMICLIRRRSPPPFPKIGKFCERHKKGITKILDIIIICIVLLWSYILLPCALDNLIKSIEFESIRTFVQHLGVMYTFAFLTMWSGISGFWIGLLSIFYSNITLIKRIILLIICLLPVVFTILQMFTKIIESPWLIVQNCLLFSAGNWIINMPAVIIGRSSFELLANILQKVKLMPPNHVD